MDGPTHYRRAEILLGECQLHDLADDCAPEVYPDVNAEPSVPAALAAAQVHATLALAAATALRTTREYLDDSEEADAWDKASGVQP